MESILPGVAMRSSILENEEFAFIETTFKDLLKNGIIANLERTFRTKSGEIMPVLFSGSTMKDSQGKIKILCL